MTDKSPSSPSNEIDEDLSAERTHDNDASQSDAGPSRYFAKRPGRRPLSLKTFKRLGAIFWHLFCQTLSSYDSSLPEVPALTRDDPKGCIQKEQVELCRLVYDTEEHRREKLEEKSTAALSLVAVLTPFIVSAAVYMASSSGFGFRERGFALVAYALSFLSLLVAFIASVRANGIRERPSLHIHSVIGPETGVIKEFSPDYFGRGLLWCASVNSAVNDHIADFVRAAQMFLVFSVMFLVFGAVPLVFVLHPDSEPQDIKKAVQVESAALQQISVSISKAAEASTQLEKDRARIEKMEADLSALRSKVAESEKQVTTKGKTGNLGSSKEPARKRSQ
jgi:hypothetical protein